MAAHNELGRWGEDVATEYLERKGYRIVERDWKSGHRDIDIIAQDGNELVFVEVKTRQTAQFGSPWEAVDYRKLHNIQSAINHYISFRRVNMRVRFDVVSIVATDRTNPQIEHIEDVQLVTYGGYRR